MRLNYRRLKYLRKEREIKQLEMARSIGLEQSLLSKYENGKVPNPSAAIVKAMANYLKCDMEDLLLTKEENSKTISNRIDVHVYFHWEENK
jgi:transcriptional regulator with XRE-family HTH domain